MLDRFRVGACAFAAALALSASSAQAMDHIVFIVDGSFFPDVTYASPGDRIIFENDSSEAHTISGIDDSWTSGVINAPGSYVLELTSEMTLGYYSPLGDGTMAEGSISFDAPQVMN